MELTIWQRLGVQRRVQQIVGRTVSFASSLWESLQIEQGKKTVDETRPNYAWWDKFRHGVHKGYELVGPQAQAFYEEITDWVTGRGITIQLEEIDDSRFAQKWIYTNSKLRKFFNKMRLLFSDVCEDTLALGDQFIVVNPDLTLSNAPPHTVEIVRQDLDYRKWDHVIIRTNTDETQVEEYYYPDRRVVRTKKLNDERGVADWRTVEYPNLIGRIPVVQFSNKRKSNELYGHPLMQRVRYTLSQINDVLQKGIQGAKVAGNPIPVFENLDDPNEIVDLNADRTDATYLDEDGNEIDRTVINWDRSPALALGSGGRFKFGSPPVGFSEDILNLTRMLFNLVQNSTHVPDHLLAGSDTETKAGVEQKVPPWIRFIEDRRERFAGLGNDRELGIEAQEGLYAVVEIWLAFLVLVDRRAMEGNVVIRWSDLTEGDVRTSFEWVKWLHSRRGLTTRTALELSGLVDNLDAEFEAAQNEDRPYEQNAFDDFVGGGRVNDDGTPDDRNEGGDAPRNPAFAGGGRR